MSMFAYHKEAGSATMTAIMVLRCKRECNAIVLEFDNGHMEEISTPIDCAVDELAPLMRSLMDKHGKVIDILHEGVSGYEDPQE